MLIISFDAVGDQEFARLAQYPAFRALAGQSAVFRGVSGVFPSNTYPVHTSVVTGAAPGVHGVTSNTEPFPAKNPLWITREDRISVQTLWQAAAGRGIKTAAVMWPVTAYSKTIRYNIPEVQARPGDSQILTSLAAGSKFLQLKMYLCYRDLLQGGIGQPALDRFSTACMGDILRKKRPGLALIHLTAYDSLCHRWGKDSAQLEIARTALDANLATLLEAAGDGQDVILFSDHGQLDVHTVLDPNETLLSSGLLRREENRYLPGESGAFIECCGGAAFLHGGKLGAGEVERLREDIIRSEGFRRLLSREEMREAGRVPAAFGFCAKEGYSYEAFGSDHLANHGYPLDMPDYQVFYMVRGCGMRPGSVSRGGSLLDIAPLAARSLGFGWPEE